MVKFREYRLGDYINMSPQQKQGGVHEANQVRAIHNSTTKWTVTLDGRPIIITGYTKLESHRALGWAVVDADIPVRTWIEILKQGRPFLMAAAVTFARFETYARADWPGARRLLARLGFIEEGILKNLTPFGDCVIARYDG